MRTYGRHFYRFAVIGCVSLGLIVAGFQVAAHAQDTARASANDLPEQRVTFDGKTYYLRHESKALNQTGREFLPEGETLERWTNMIGIQEHPSIDDREGYARTIMRLLKQHNPDAQYQMYTKDGEVMLDFITWLPNSPDFVEFNVMRLVAREGGGTVLYQVAHRAYGDQRREFLTNLREFRQEEVKKVAEQLPQIVQENER